MASRRLTLTLAVLQLTVLTRVSLPLLGVLPLLMPMPTLALLPFLTTPGVLLPLLHLLLRPALGKWQHVLPMLPLTDTQCIHSCTHLPSDRCLMAQPSQWSSA